MTNVYEPEADTRRVLVVDDDPNFREEIVEMIAESDVRWQVSKAAGPNEALQLIANEIQIDCIFLDIQFPGAKSGIDFLREVRGTLWTTPIYILTNFKQTDDTLSIYHTSRQEIRELGAIEWIQKNNSPDFQRIDLSLDVYRKISDSLSSKILTDLKPCITRLLPEIIQECLALQSVSAHPDFSKSHLIDGKRSIESLTATTTLLTEALNRIVSELNGSYSPPSLIERIEHSKRSSSNTLRSSSSAIHDIVFSSLEKPAEVSKLSDSISQWLNDEEQVLTGDQKFFRCIHLLNDIHESGKPTFLEAGALVIGRYFADTDQADLAGAAVHSAAQKVFDRFREMALNLEKIALGYAHRSGDHTLIRRICLDIEGAL